MMQIGDYVRFGEEPYNVFVVTDIWDGGRTLGVATIHGIYTELPADDCKLLDRDYGFAERRRQSAIWNKQCR